MLNGKGKVQFFLSYPLVPGEIAVDGIRFDFCDGCRILFPNKNGSHRVVLIDNDTGYVLQNTVVCEGGKFRSNIRYFVNWHIDIYNEDNKIIFNHDFSPVGKQVLFVINSNAIGDTLAWFPYIDKFARKHNCMAGVVMSDLMREIIEPEYPSITFFDRSAEKTLSPYASYMLGGFSEPFTEFNTPYRVGNWNVCHGCWSNIGKNFTCSQEVKYKCSKMISSRMVINQLKRILGE